MGIQFNNKQKLVLSEAKSFYHSSSRQVFEFAGYAGTGKSVMLNAIKEELNLSDDEIAPMSYIGQAAINMRYKGFPNAKTCHSWLYSPVITAKKDKKGKVIYDEYFDRPIYNIDFEYKPLNDIKLIFLDEAGAVPYELATEIESRGIKIIAAGDLGQLPPVVGVPKYLYGKDIIILDEIMRQKDGSAILHLAEMARKGIDIKTGCYSDAIVIDFQDLDLETIAKANMIVCGRNKTRDLINTVYRNNILGYTRPIPFYGERIVCRKNNWHIESDGINLANGLIGTVMNDPGVEVFNGESFIIDFKPDMCNNSVFNKLPIDYKYFIAPYDKKKDMGISEHYVGEKFEYAYAITCHCAQGSQYSQGIYIEDYMPRDIQNNINYTGITRFSDKLVYVKPKRKKYY